MIQRTAANTSIRSTAASTAIPFRGEATAEWTNALERANRFAKMLGYASVESAPSGIRARGLPAPGAITSIEEQDVFLVGADRERASLGRVLPEAEHLRSLKSEDQLTDELELLIARHHLAEHAWQAAVPFQFDASAQLLPALKLAADFAKQLGFAGLAREDSGIRARGLGAAGINAIEEQKLTLIGPGGEAYPLPRLALEVAHLQTLKSTATLLRELQPEILRIYQAQSESRGEAGRSLIDGGAPRAPAEFPAVGRLPSR